jgi:hypothetical protein
MDKGGERGERGERALGGRLPLLNAPPLELGNERIELHENVRPLVEKVSHRVEW